MSLKIQSFHKHGDAKEEYVLLLATEDLNVHDYAIIDRTYDEDGNVSDVFKHFYRFPSQEVKKGEYVSLRTNKGTYTKGRLSNDKPVHRFYWGSDSPVWNDENVESAEVLQLKTVSKMVTGHPKPKKKVTFNFRPNNLKFGSK